MTKPPAQVGLTCSCFVWRGTWSGTKWGSSKEVLAQGTYLPYTILEQPNTFRAPARVCFGYIES